MMMMKWSLYAQQRRALFVTCFARDGPQLKKVQTKRSKTVPFCQISNKQFFFRYLENRVGFYFKIWRETDKYIFFYASVEATNKFQKFRLLPIYACFPLNRSSSKISQSPPPPLPGRSNKIAVMYCTVAEVEYKCHQINRKLTDCWCWVGAGRPGSEGGQRGPRVAAWCAVARPSWPAPRYSPSPTGINPEMICIVDMGWNNEKDE